MTKRTSRKPKWRSHKRTSKKSKRTSRRNAYRSPRAHSTESDGRALLRQAKRARRDHRYKDAYDLLIRASIAGPLPMQYDADKHFRFEVDTERRKNERAIKLGYTPNSRLSPKRRSKLPASKFVFPKDRAWPIESAKGARDAIEYMKMGRVRSGADYLDIRNFIVRHYPAVWRKYGFNSSWPRTQAAKKKGIAHRRASRRVGHKIAANRRRR